MNILERIIGTPYNCNSIMPLWQLVANVLPAELTDFQHVFQTKTRCLTSSSLVEDRRFSDSERPARYSSFFR